MRVVVNRAVFGERDGCHAVIAASLDEREILAEVRLRSDLPPHHLPNLAWDPLLRGFPVRGWYVVMRTFPDLEASRSGMVKSFAVLISLTEASKVGDLYGLFAELPKTRTQEWSCTRSTVDLRETTSAQGAPTPGLAKLVRELLEHSDRNRPIVWVGQEGFAEVVAALWSAMSPNMRRHFGFDLLFAPQDVERLGLTIVAVPGSAASRWSAFPQVCATDPAPPDRTPAEAFLLGQPEGEPIRKLLQDLEADPQDPSALKIAALCLDYRAKLAKASVPEVHAFLGLIATLQPDPQRGRELKDEVLRRYTGLSAQFESANILALRNFNPAPFGSGGAIVVDIITRWARAHLPKASEAESNGRLLLQALKAEAYCRPWNELVLAEAGALLRDMPDQMAPVLWMWWADDWKLGQFAAGHLAADKNAESALVRTCPQELNHELAKALRSLAKARGWSELHAAVCASSLPPAEAFAAQIKLPRAAGAGAGLGLLARRFPTSTTIEAALALGDTRLIDLAGEGAVREPGLLEGLEMREPTAQQILWSALQVRPDTWQKLSNRQAMLHVLLDLIVAGKVVAESLIRHLSSTPEANVVDYPQRATLWGRLTPESANGFLLATAWGWIERFRASPTTEPAPEAPLATAVFSTSHRDRLLAFARPSDITAVVHAFERFPQLDEPALEAWIARLPHSGLTTELSSTQATQLGALVQQRQWSGAARALRDALPCRRDLAPAVRECLGLFGVFERLYLQVMLPGPVALDSNEFWAALETELVACYPEGPMDRKLWSRARGDDSMLDRHGNGRQQWHGAIHLLRNGGGGKSLNIHKLLSEARGDYWKNSQLATLEQCARKLNL